MLNDVFEPFLSASPVSVMFRATLERVLSPQKMDAIFAKTAIRQKEGELLFSTCVDLMALVVAKVQKSVHMAYQARAEQFQVSVRSVYNKLAGIEPQVSEQMVVATAAELKAVIGQMKLRLPRLLPGYDVRVLDGNYLAGTDHRLKELRALGAAALPGLGLCVFNPQLNLIEDVLACEDGHANERGLIDRLLPKIASGQCWVADRNFCVFSFLFGIARRQAFFVVRQHPQVVGEPLGKCKRVRRVPGGVLYEQKRRLSHSNGEVLDVRRLTIKLDQPTRFGESEIHLLTNLPCDVLSVRIAAVYRKRWSIETAFMHLATVLRSEVNTLAYPDAALFGFCIGLLLYNVLAFLQIALRAAHRPKTNDRTLSMYKLGDEIAGVYRGMMIAIPARHWRHEFATQSNHEFAKQILAMANRVTITKFFANPKSQQKPPHKKISGHRGNHVSTIKILQQRKSKR
jgi:hypothetical protein